MSLFSANSTCHLCSLSHLTRTPLSLPSTVLLWNSSVPPQHTCCDFSHLNKNSLDHMSLYISLFHFSAVFMAESLEELSFSCSLSFSLLILYYSQTFALTTTLKLLSSKPPMWLNAMLKLSSINLAPSGMLDNSILSDMPSSFGFQTTILFWISLLWMSFSASSSSF